MINDSIRMSIFLVSHFQGHAKSGKLKFVHCSFFQNSSPIDPRDDNRILKKSIYPLYSSKSRATENSVSQDVSLILSWLALGAASS